MTLHECCGLTVCPCCYFSSGQLTDTEQSEEDPVPTVGTSWTVSRHNLLQTCLGLVHTTQIQRTAQHQSSNHCFFTQMILSRDFLSTFPQFAIQDREVLFVPPSNPVRFVLMSDWQYPPVLLPWITHSQCEAECAAE